ncbi:MAG: RluA family pseudouridine synthase [Treponema sp.]|nr:RluA family pseudouridine synthase [Treponema sp.]
MKSLKEIPVLFENDVCMVLNKPHGLAVQGGEGVSTSLDSILSEKYSPRPLLVHRLDRDTSGAILVAKTKGAAAAFSTLLAGSVNGAAITGGEKKSRAIVKQYWGVCAGIPRPPQGIIRHKLDALGEARGKFRGERGAKQQESLTHYKVLSSSTAGEVACSLVELELGTGRMHQIRRHLAGIGHPLLGDDKYGDFPLNKKLKKACGIKRMLLHAVRLAIPPVPDLLPQGLDISAPLPDYFAPFAPDAPNA